MTRKNSFFGRIKMYSTVVLMLVAGFASVERASAATVPLDPVAAVTHMNDSNFTQLTSIDPVAGQFADNIDKVVSVPVVVANTAHGPTRVVVGHSGMRYAVLRNADMGHRNFSAKLASIMVRGANTRGGLPKTC